MKTKTVIKKAGPADLVALQDLCISIYTHYFGNHWLPAGLDQYLEEQFGTRQLTFDLVQDHIDYFFIDHHSELAGFLKINYAARFDDLPQRRFCELEKMYVTPAHQGQGIGQRALNDLIDILLERGEKDLFLCVLDTNQAAISFYEKLGFTFHGKMRLKYTDFREHLKGLHRMRLLLPAAGR